MKRVDLKHIPVRPRNPWAGWERKVHWVLFALFVINAGLVWVRLWALHVLFTGRNWPDGSLLVLAAGTTLAALSRRLPAQNVILAAVVIGIAGGGAESLGAAAGVPFGPLVYHPENIGRLMFDLLPWSVPLIWVTVILNARGVARLMLRRYRAKSYYGFWVMGLTVLLVVVFELSFEPYATALKEYWSWKPTRIHSDWYTTPWSNFLGWAVVAGLILLFVTPALINKSPIKYPPSYEPLIVWEVIGILLLTGIVHSRLWGAVYVIAGQMILVAVFSVFGAGTAALKKRPVGQPFEAAG